MPWDGKGHAIDALQEWEKPAEGRPGCRLPNLVGEGVVLTRQLVSHPTLGHSRDQQRQGHHHQEPLETGGLCDTQRRHKKHGVFAQPKATLHCALACVASDYLPIGHGRVGESGAQDDTRLALLLVRDRGSVSHSAGVDVPLDHCDGGRCGGVGRPVRAYWLCGVRDACAT